MNLKQRPHRLPSMSSQAKIEAEEKKVEPFMNAYINKEVSEKSSKKYLIFRPYIDPMDLRPYQPPDKGYYFKFNNTNVKIV